MADATLVLHARIGKTSARFVPPVAEAANDARAAAPGSRLSAPVLLAALVLALWPQWQWMAQRLTDGSDEPWGVLALCTVLVLVGREWRKLETPSAVALCAGGALLGGAALGRFWLPPLVAAAIAMAALGTFLTAARPGRSSTALVALLLLALPVIASLQFYFGYPLRLVTAALAAPLLQALGFVVQAAGAALVHDGRVVLVDPPCAGIGMLWVGAYAAALLSYAGNASARRTLLNGVVAAVCVFVANVVRNVALFFPEALDLGWPEWTHAAIGLLAFGLALLPIVLFAQSAGRKQRGGWPQWPRRYHRQLP
jgi:exosortase/archaeosortase family protein